MQIPDTHDTSHMEDIGPMKAMSPARGLISMGDKEYGEWVFMALSVSDTSYMYVCHRSRVLQN